jgi:hypothetical protein
MLLDREGLWIPSAARDGEKDVFARLPNQAVLKADSIPFGSLKTTCPVSAFIRTFTGLRQVLRKTEVGFGCIASFPATSEPPTAVERAF